MQFINCLKQRFQTHIYLYLILCMFAVGIFLRLYNFENRLIFGPEQGISFLTSAGNLEKFSLLGETNLIRTTSAGHIPFHGAVYSYLLLPLLVIFNYRVLPVTLAFCLLNIFTAYIFLRISEKMFGKTIAAFSLFFFLFSDIMIHHSLFAWIVNPTPLLGVLTLWCLFLLWQKRDRLSPVFWIGTMSGLGFGFQNFYLFFAGLLFILLISLTKKKIQSVIVFLFGVILGSLPTVIFDLRHDFYHTRTFFQYFLDVLAGKSSGDSSYYNFLYLYPYLYIIYAFISKRLLHVWKPLALIPVTLFLYFSFTSPLFNLHQSVGMAPGITLKSLEMAASTIASTAPKNFNVATLWDFDTRAYPLRYLLKYYYGKTAQPVEEYKNLDALYVFAPEKYDIANPQVWELQSYLPYQTKDLVSPATNYHLYQLTK